MRMFQPETFLLMRREIDDHDPPAWLQHARGLAYGAGRVIHEMQDLMQDHKIEPGEVRRQARKDRLAAAAHGAGRLHRDLARATASIAGLTSRPTARLARGPKSFSICPVPMPRSRMAS